MIETQSASPQQFVHLRVHSQYSLIDSTLSLKDIFRKAQQYGMPAVAITDEANLYAAVKVYQLAKSMGIKPLFGADLWCDCGLKSPARLTLFCQNITGYRRLCELLSQAYHDEARYLDLPLLQWADLTPQKLEGLIGLSGAQQGHIGQLLMTNQLQQAEQALAKWQQLLPDQRFYIELQRLGASDENDYISQVLLLAQAHQVPVVATNPVCFEKADDYDIHQLRVCIATGHVLADPKKPKRHQLSQYFKTSQQMLELFDDVPSAIKQTVLLSQRLNLHFDMSQTYLPDFPVPQGITIDDYMVEESRKGLAQRLSEIKCDEPEIYHQRLKHELAVIAQMGFAGYFLIVADFIAWSRSQDIPVGPGRGSGAGSLVAYALGITDIDPIPYGLLFERFLNPERVSMPDFDIDFCMEKRDCVIDYVAEKYGRDSVSQIITYGTMAAKAVVRDVGRVLSYPYGFVDSIAKLIPMDLGMTLPVAIAQEEVLRTRMESDDEVATLMDYALKLEGTIRNVGKHAGGVVIAPSALTDFCPLYSEPGSTQAVTQFDKDDLEKIGLVKFDFLGLRNLTIIKDTVDIINRQFLKEGQPPFNIKTIPLNDDASFELLKQCDTSAVFQLESRGMKDLIARLQPDSFEEIIALVALFRPGPLQSGMVDDFIDRKHGRSEVIYPHELTADILKPTYGIILYQEQVMQIAQVMAGYTLGAADLLRRAMGKKKPEEMAKQRQIFVEGAVKNDIDAKVAEGIFDLMEKFAGYGFNKSHSAAYALVAYQTAYLKAHYREAFMAAVLSSDMDNTDKVVALVDECQQVGIEIKTPSINHSQFHFSVVGKEVLYGFGAIKGVGENAIEEILHAREQGGDFKDLFDLCCRLDPRKLNRRVLEALIYSGALDGFGVDRATLANTVNWAIKAALQVTDAKKSQQSDLFGQAGHQDIQCQYQSRPPWTKIEQLAYEFQVLGLYFSGHPMTEYWPQLAPMGLQRFDEIGVPKTAKKPTRKREKRPTTKIAGLVQAIRKIKTKMGKLMMVLTLDDGDCKYEVVVFSEVIEIGQQFIKVNDLLIATVEVSLDNYSGSKRLVATELFDLNLARCQMARALVVSVNWAQANEGVLQKLYEGVKPYRGGETRLYIVYHDQKKQRQVYCCDMTWSLHLTVDILEQLDQWIPSQNIEWVFGPQAVLERG